MKLDEAEALVQALALGLARQPDPEALDALYASLPRMTCKGECASSCGPVPATPLERQRISQRGQQWSDGVVISLPDGQSAASACPALDQKKLRCRVYEDRPTLCRLWGLLKSLECPWGCVPEGGHLDDVAGMRLWNLAQWYGGDPAGIEPERWETAAANPQYQQELARLLEENRPVREEPRFMQATIRVRPAD